MTDSTQSTIDARPTVEWGTPPPIRAGRNPAKTHWIDSQVAELKLMPDRWARVATGVPKGKQEARHYIRRNCATRVVTIAPGVYDVWAMWPYYTDADGDPARRVLPRGEE